MISQLEAKLSSLSLDPKPPSHSLEFTPLEYFTEIPANLSSEWLCCHYPQGLRAHLICCYSKAEHRNVSFIRTEEGFELKPLNTRISLLAQLKSRIVLEGIYVSSLHTFYIYDAVEWNGDYGEYPYDLRLFLLNQKLAELEYPKAGNTLHHSQDLEVRFLNLLPATPEKISLLQKAEPPEDKDLALFTRYQAYVQFGDCHTFSAHLRRDTHQQKFLNKGLLFFHKESRALVLQLVKREFVETSSQGYFSAMLWVDAHFNFKTRDNVIVYRSSLIDCQQWKIDPKSLYHVLYEGLEECMIAGQSGISLSKMILVAKLQEKRNRPSSFSHLIYKHQVSLNMEVKISGLMGEHLDDYFDHALSLK